MPRTPSRSLYPRLPKSNGDFSPVRLRAALAANRSRRSLFTVLTHGAIVHSVVATAQSPGRARALSSHVRTRWRQRDNRPLHERCCHPFGNADRAMLRAQTFRGIRARRFDSPATSCAFPQHAAHLGTLVELLARPHPLQRRCLRRPAASPKEHGLQQNQSLAETRPTPTYQPASRTLSSLSSGPNFRPTQSREAWQPTAVALPSAPTL
jgi:hypothetical protein